MGASDRPPSNRKMKHRNEKFSRSFVGDGESAFRNLLGSVGCRRARRADQSCLSAKTTYRYETRIRGVPHKN
ncbi:hypothetical protein KCU92_g344, partial [Aureobasidium melanogenum]